MTAIWKHPVVAGIVCLLVESIQVDGHGRLLQPPSRSSLWRFKDSNDFIRDSPRYGDIVPNYSDNQLFCGGSQTQKRNKGKCGVCGDSYEKPRPRDNEAGGKYGLGIISARYNTGDEITVIIDITAQHKGYFEFRLCVWNNPSAYITQECLDRHLLTVKGGSTRYEGITETGKYEIQVNLPGGVTCIQCVLQWRYHTGNSWGCDGMRCGLGYGHQEEFYGCADIAIEDEENTQDTTTSTRHISSTSPSSTAWTRSRYSSLPSTTTTTTAATPPVWPEGSMIPSYPDAVTTIRTSTTQAETENPCEDKIFGKYYKWDCKSYFVCLSGYSKPLTINCPAGTVYDGTICNHPYWVPKPCGNGVINNGKLRLELLFELPL